MRIPDGVARVWHYRWRVELEAADQFARLSEDLVTVHGTDSLSRMAAAAAHDEREHATYCEKIVRWADFDAPGPRPVSGARLGPDHLSVRQRALYACVSLSCVTESLSAALLVSMQRRAKEPQVREVVHAILEDEISHSRLGWAELARQADAGSVGWLSAYLPGMIRGAVKGDVPPRVERNDGGASRDLSTYGILPGPEARAVMAQTLESVVFPGLRKFGVDTMLAEKFS